MSSIVSIILALIIEFIGVGLPKLKETLPMSSKESYNAHIITTEINTCTLMMNDGKQQVIFSR